MSDNKRPWETYENRCDRCDAESWFRATKIEDMDPANFSTTEGPTLYFCGHHGHKFQVALEAQDFYVENWYHEINLAPSISANAIADE